MVMEISLMPLAHVNPTIAATTHRPRRAQLAGVALSAGVAAYAAGFQAGLIIAAVLAAAGATTLATMLPAASTQSMKAPRL
jgi:hypothetical protein